MDAHAQVVAALAALADGDPQAACAALAPVAPVAPVAGGPGLLATALAEHLSRQGGGSVYDAPAAFAAFIRGGGNQDLYRAVSAALAGLYDRHRPAALLDVGCGDGTALVPALLASRFAPAQVDLVEPSAALLERAVHQLSAAGAATSVRAWPTTAQEAVATLLPGRSWALAQATFALHTLVPEQRTAVLAALRPHVGLLAVVEFDVPGVPVASTEHLDFLAGTYERGLGEYDTDRDLVAQGFLMPVLTGQLVPGAVRHTFEQPAPAWLRQVQDAGYRDVVATPLWDYWSSPAFLLTARGGATDPGDTGPSGPAARSR